MLAGLQCIFCLCPGRKARGKEGVQCWGDVGAVHRCLCRPAENWKEDAPAANSSTSVCVLSKLSKMDINLEDLREISGCSFLIALKLCLIAQHRKAVECFQQMRIHLLVFLGCVVLIMEKDVARQECGPVSSSTCEQV